MIVNGSESDALYRELLDRADNNLELVAKTAITHLLGVIAERDTIRAERDLLNAENARLAAEVAVKLPPPKRNRGRPVKFIPGGLKSGFALKVPNRLRKRRTTSGAPQKYALPQPTKVHAATALERIETLAKLGHKYNYREGAEIELAANGICQDHPDYAKLVRELQRRIGDAKRSG